MLTVQYITCAGETGAQKLATSQAFQTWANKSDALLMGRDLMIEIPGKDPDSCIVQVALVNQDEADAKKATVAAIFINCDHAMGIDKSQTVVAGRPVSNAGSIIIPRGRV